MEMDINMKNHQACDTQLRFTQMQSYKCNEGVCEQEDIDALNNETQAW